MLLSREALRRIGCALTLRPPTAATAATASSATAATASSATAATAAIKAATHRHPRMPLPPRGMPLPPRGVPNDVHIVRWAARLGVRLVHSNLFSYASLPADARLVYVAGARVGRDVADYVGAPLGGGGGGASGGGTSADGLSRRSAFAEAVGGSGALEPQMLGAVVLHRVPPRLMRSVHARLVAQQQQHASQIAG